jgi:hypothetical protein
MNGDNPPKFVGPTSDARLYTLMRAGDARLLWIEPPR